jgi:membrane-bound lytic murein transglycosylase D
MTKPFGILLVVSIIASAAAASASTREESFPRPTNLEPNIAFWKKVFTEWSERDHAIHDKERLDVVYEVVQTEAPRSNGKTPAAGVELIRLRMAHYTGILRLLEAQGPDAVGDEGQRLYSLWGCPCTPGTLEAAADRLRSQRGIRERFTLALRRAEGLRPKILPILRQNNVPDELAALPLIESSFDSRARSHAQAAGLWQFLRSTGRRFGLTVRGRHDERYDPLRSTGAAARMLRHHQGELRSWPLAITAYNHGLGGVKRAVTTVGTNDIGRIVAEYRGPRFGFSSRNFYAEFLAAVDLMDLHFAQAAAPASAR